MSKINYNPHAFHRPTKKKLVLNMAPRYHKRQPSPLIGSYNPYDFVREGWVAPSWKDPRQNVVDGITGEISADRGIQVSLSKDTLKEMGLKDVNEKLNVLGAAVQELPDNINTMGETMLAEFGTIVDLLDSDVIGGLEDLKAVSETGFNNLVDIIQRADIKQPEALDLHRFINWRFFKENTASVLYYLLAKAATDNVDMNKSPLAFGSKGQMLPFQKLLQYFVMNKDEYLDLKSLKFRSQDETLNVLEDDYATREQMIDALGGSLESASSEAGPS